MRAYLWFTIAALSFSPLFTAHAQDSYADLVARVKDAVVNVQTSQRIEETRSDDPFRFFFRQQPRRNGPLPRGAGSGFLISSDGYIVTNRHVVENAEDITVSLTNNRTFPAKLIGSDDNMDVALIKIEGEGDLPFLKIGDSSKARIGDTLFAMGYPLQLGFSVTKGILSGIGRNMRTGGVDLANYLQTDADITFGNSGGPLINTQGEVVGLNTLIVSSGETYGFAIPSNLIMHSVDQLKTYGRVRRGAIGVSLESLSPEALEYYGVDHGALISGVSEGAPAYRAGIRREDVILEINGAKVRDSGDVVATISSMPPGAEIRLLVLSNGRKSEKSVKLADRNDLYGENAEQPETESEPESEEYSLGLSATPLDNESRRELDLDPDVRGMVVTAVDPNSIAFRQGIRPGNIITHVNNQPIGNDRDLRSALKGVEVDAPLPVRLIQVGRDLGGLNLNQRTVFLRKRAE